MDIVNDGNIPLHSITTLNHPMPNRHLTDYLKWLPRRWHGWSRRRRITFVFLSVLGAFVIFLVAMTATGISAALGARSAAGELEDELRGITPLDMIQVTDYQTLENQFHQVEESADRARSRLSFLRIFRWTPILGGRIKEAQQLVDMGYFLARAGGELAGVYRTALDAPLDEFEPEVASGLVAESIRAARPRLDQVQSDLDRAAQIRDELPDSGTGGRFVRLLDQYLPAIQAATFVSRTGPDAIGEAYVVGRGLDELRVLADDPLEVIANPQEVGDSLTRVSEGAARLSASLALIRQGAEEGGLVVDASPRDDRFVLRPGSIVPGLRSGGNSGEATLSVQFQVFGSNNQNGSHDREDVLDVLRLMEQGAIILQHTTAGTRGLVKVAEAIEIDGFLTAEFGAMAGPALQRASEELKLALLQAESFQQRISGDGIQAGQLLPTSLLEGTSRASDDSFNRLEMLLEDIQQATDFFISFLGFNGPRTYLLLGQNQNEIRATGGFIGVAVEARLDQGELASLIYHDSTTVDALPLEDNPFPPDALYWYLWMGRLLFRDANWEPHFPASAVSIAELYQAGKGVQVDGVIAGTKGLALDMVDIFDDITVPQLDGPLTRDIAESYTEGISPYACQPQHSSTRGKRCFDEDLFTSLQDRVTSSLDGDLKRNLIELLRSQLSRKNLLVHVLDPDEGSFLWERGWNGAVPGVDHDYLMVIDSSLPGHSTAGVQRNLEYRVDLNPGGQSESWVRLRYKHGGQPKDLICRQGRPSEYDCYWNYFRLYLSPLARNVDFPSVPLHEGAERLIWGYPDPQSATLNYQLKMGSGRFAEVGGYITVEPGSTTTVPVHYYLEPEVLREIANQTYQYRLLVQKQPGMDRDVVTVAVDLPPGSELLSTSLIPRARRGQMLLFEFNLLEDTSLTVSFKTS